jgi:hypothetical protein
MCGVVCSHKFRDTTARADKSFFEQLVVACRGDEPMTQLERLKAVLEQHGIPVCLHFLLDCG